MFMRRSSGFLTANGRKQYREQTHLVSAVDHGGGYEQLQPAHVGVLPPTCGRVRVRLPFGVRAGGLQNVPDHARASKFKQMQSIVNQQIPRKENEDFAPLF